MPSARLRRDAFGRMPAPNARRATCLWSGPHSPANDNERPRRLAWVVASTLFATAASGGIMVALALLTR